MTARVVRSNKMIFMIHRHQVVIPGRVVLVAVRGWSSNDSTKHSPVYMPKWSICSLAYT